MSAAAYMLCSAYQIGCLLALPTRPMDKAMQCQCDGHHLLHASCKLGSACCCISPLSWQLQLVWCAHAISSLPMLDTWRLAAL